MNMKIEWIEREHNGKIEKFAIRRSIDGYRVVYPNKNQDGTLNWKNILLGGSWWNLIKSLVVLGLILLFFWVYNHDTYVCRENAKAFVEHCTTYIRYLSELSKNTSLDFDFNNFTIIK